MLAAEEVGAPVRARATAWWWSTRRTTSSPGGVGGAAARTTTEPGRAADVLQGDGAWPGCASAICWPSPELVREVEQGAAALQPQLLLAGGGPGRARGRRARCAATRRRGCVAARERAVRGTWRACRASRPIRRSANFILFELDGRPTRRRCSSRSTSGACWCATSSAYPRLVALPARERGHARRRTRRFLGGAAPSALAAAAVRGEERASMKRAATGTATVERKTQRDGHPPRPRPRRRRPVEGRAPASASSTTCSRRSPTTRRFDLDVRCKGDLHVDAHHTVEDVGIALRPGACAQALGRQAGHRALRPRLRAARRGAARAA